MIRSVYPLKRELPSLQAAKEYVRKVRTGKGRYKNAKLEIHYNARKTYRGRWNVVAVDHEPVPGGTPCVECGEPIFEDDYICAACREAAHL